MRVRAGERMRDGSGERPFARLLGLARAEMLLCALVVMALLGIGISAYLTAVHYANVPLLCSTSGPIDCARVTSSIYSVVPFTQIPITVPGMLWFAASGGLALFALRRAWLGQAEPPRLRQGHFALAAVGLVFVLYLVYAEIVLLHRFCEWCTAIHLLTLLTFIITLLRVQDSQESQDGGTPPVHAKPARATSGPPIARAHSGRVPPRPPAARNRRRRH